jgi:hypothetical protein
LIATVAVDALDKGKQPTYVAVKCQRTAVTILYAGRMHCHVNSRPSVSTRMCRLRPLTFIRWNQNLPEAPKPTTLQTFFC